MILFRSKIISLYPNKFKCLYLSSIGLLNPSIIFTSTIVQNFLRPIYLSIYLSKTIDFFNIYFGLSVYLFFKCISVHTYIRFASLLVLSVCLSPSVSLSLSLCLCLSVCLSLSLSRYTFPYISFSDLIFHFMTIVSLSIYLSFSISILIHIYLSIYLSISVWSYCLSQCNHYLSIYQSDTKALELCYNINFNHRSLAYFHIKVMISFIITAEKIKIFLQNTFFENSNSNWNAHEMLKVHILHHWEFFQICIFIELTVKNVSLQNKKIKKIRIIFIFGWR